MVRGFRIAGILSLLTATVVLVGCGGGMKTADVSGTVSYDGKPVDDGSISFIPADGNGPSGGGVIQNGKYTATKVPVGNVKVKITGSKAALSTEGPGRPPEGPGRPPATQEYILEKYNTKTELTFDVKSGVNEKNWELAK